MDPKNFFSPTANLIDEVFAVILSKAFNININFIHFFREIFRLVSTFILYLN